VERITLPLGTGSVIGDYAASPAPFCVVWLHGFGGHRGGEKSVAVREECERRGWAFAAFDFRGHGESSDEVLHLTAPRLLEDLSHVRNFLATRGHTRLGLVGSSMGGFAAAWFARRNPECVVGCVFVAPGFMFLERRWSMLTEEQREEWRRTGRHRITSEWVDLEIGYGLVQDREEYCTARLVEGWAKPALLFHGCADNVVPYSASLDFQRDVPFPDVEVRLFKNGDHRLVEYKHEIAEGAGRFFARLLTVAAA
jgi:pimeloyl-ACP methyl ester carboxylesterase